MTLTMTGTMIRTRFARSALQVGSLSDWACALGCTPVGMGWLAGALSFTGRASGDRIHIVCIPILGRRHHCDAAAGEWLFILTSSRRLVGLGRLESVMIHAVALADRRLQGER